MRGSERWKESTGVGKREGQIGLEREERNSRAGKAPQPGLGLPVLSALAWGQRKVGALRSVAFSVTQFRSVKGRKERRRVSASRAGLSLPVASSVEG